MYMYSSVSVIHCRALTYLTALSTILFQSAGELIVAPRDTESKVGDITYFNCSTDLDYADIFWYHGNKYIYNGHGILEPYNGRFEIERISSTGSHNLVIHSVEPDDAGEYICSDDDGAGTTRSAELIVLDNDLDCQSNMKSDGVIGQNAFNIPSDEVQLTCSVTYHGNKPPRMRWRKVGDNDYIDYCLTSNITSRGRFTLTVKFKGDFTLDNSAYVCETTKSTQNQYKCTSETIKVLYLFSGNMIEQKVFRGDKITCTNDSNTFPCINIWYHDNKTFDETITTDSLGEYLCRVQCRIRGTDYTFLAQKAFVADSATSALSNTSGKLAAAAVVPIIVIIILVVVLTVIFVTRYFKRRNLFSGNMIEQKVFRGDKITCTTDSNTFPCINMWYHDNKTFDETITTESLGEYLCWVQCRIREADYIFLAQKAFVADPAASALSNTSGKLAASAVVPIIVIIILVVFLNVIFVTRCVKRRNLAKSFREHREEFEHLYAMEKNNPESAFLFEDEIELLRTIKKGVNRGEKVIRGVAFLNGKLFVVRENSSKLRIYDCNDDFSSFNDWKLIKLNELVSTVDMCSSNLIKCLYIMDGKALKLTKPGEVFKISSEGKVLKNWEVKDGSFGNLSATAEGNLIITVENRHVLLEYSPDGELVSEIKLPSLCYGPSHAFKQGDRYIVSHGEYYDPFKGVCLVDQDGNVDKSFGTEISNSCLAVSSSGCVIVADPYHNRVLLLDSNLEFKTKLVPKYKQRFSFPFDICLDETTGLLVVVMIGGDPPEETFSKAGDCGKEAEEGKMAPTGGNDWKIDKTCRVLIFDVKSVLQKYSGKLLLQE